MPSDFFLVHLRQPRHRHQRSLPCLGTSVPQWAVANTVESAEAIILARYDRMFLLNSKAFDADEQEQLNLSAETEYCILKSLIRRLLCVPATSAPVERVCLQGGLIRRPI